MKCKLTIAYDGTPYEGWRSQRAEHGVAHQIELAWQRCFSCEANLISSSRTDSGVHARGLVAHSTWPNEKFSASQIVAQLNAQLPETIRIMEVETVVDCFDARYDATGKEYRYTIWNHAAMHPLLRERAWHAPKPLQLNAMREAAAALVGEHDFRAFTVKREGELGNAVRRLQRCEIHTNDHEITIILDGSGFLYKMCRAIVGTLVQIGEGKISVSEINAMLDPHDAKSCGMIAPAQGLTLWRVIYADPNETI
jgi:tRNA pseudouridine38-40 synthase